MTKSRKERTIWAVLDLLRKGQSTSFRPVIDGLMLGVDALPLTAAKKDGIFEHVYGDDQVSVRGLHKSSAVSRDSRLGFVDRQTAKLQRHSASIGKLSEARKIHVILGPGAPLPDYLTTGGLSHASYTIYAFGNLDAAIRELGLKERVTLCPIRDQFNDISEEGEELFERARDLSRSLVDQYVRCLDGEATVMDKETVREVLALELEDRLTHTASIVRCIRSVVQEIQNGEPIVFVDGSSPIVSDAWSMIDPGADHPCLITFDHKRRGLYRRQKRSLMQQLSRSPRAIAVQEPVSKDAGKQLFGALQRALETKANETCAEIADNCLQSDGNVLFLYRMAGQAYKDAIASLSSAAAIQRAAGQLCHPVFLHCGADDDVNALSFVDHEDDGYLYSSCDLDLFVQQKPELDRTFSTPSAASLRSRIDLGSLQVRDNRLLSEDAIVAIVEKHLTEGVSWVLFAYMLGQKLAERETVNHIATLPNRHPLIRAIAAGFMAERDTPDKAVTEVQCLNVLPHPKYRAPMADRLSVIDKSAVELHSGYFGFTREDIVVCGAPQDDGLLNRVASRDWNSVALEMGVHPGNRVVVLISQLQPFERMSAVLAELLDYANSKKNTHIVVRLHPREGPDREAAYRSFVAARGRSAPVSFSSIEPIEHIIGVGDVFVTFYSNMAREVALCGKSVVVPSFVGWTPPIDLVGAGLASSATNTEEFARFLDQGLKGNGLSAESKVAGPTSRILDLFASPEPNALPLQPARRLRQRAPADEASRWISGHAALSVVGQGNVRLGELEKRLGAVGTVRSNVPALNRSPQGAPSVYPEIDAAAKVTDSVSHELVDTIVSAIERVDTDLGELLNRLRPALWLYFRPLLINAAREDYRAAACVRECTSSLLLLAGSHEELIDLSTWSTAFAPEYITRRAALVRSKKVQTFKDVDRLLSEQSTITRAKHQPLETHVDLKVIRDWLSALSETPFIETSRAETLFLLDWSLKTVPGTIGPVIRQMADTRMLIACFRSKDVKPVDQFIVDEGLAETGTLSPDELMSTAPEFGNHTSDALRSIVAEELDGLLSRQSSPFIKTALRSAVEQFVSSGFPKILSWHQFCKQFFEQGGQMTVACPGRQWYSEIAHLQAAHAQGFSATIQNAYMTAAYTYTAPSGDFITCIDTWTRELLIDEYGVQAEKLAVVSTPRFDYIANIKNGSKEDARAVLSLPAEPTIVLFATQVGLETNTVQIINGLKTTASSNDGRPVLVLVKPHPRTDDTELITIRDAVADFASIELLEDMSISLETLLVASDIVITIYSNVGIEAAVCEKDLIIFKPDGMALPLPLDEYEIGWTVETADDIPHAIHGFQTNSETAMAVRDRQARFRSDNPHMTNGTSAVEISRTLLDKLSSKV